MFKSLLPDSSPTVFWMFYYKRTEELTCKGGFRKGGGLDGKQAIERDSKSDKGKDREKKRYVWVGGGVKGEYR